MKNDTPDTDMASRTTQMRPTPHSARRAAEQMSTRRVLVSDRSAPGVARRLVREVAAGLPYAVIERAELAVSELVTNAVRHGSEPGSNIDVVIDRSGEQLAIVVSDRGRVPSHRDDDDAGGYGLDIVREIADDVEVDVGAGWTVRALFTLQPPRRRTDDS